MTEKLRIGLFHSSLPGPGKKPCGVDVAVHRLAEATANRTDAIVTVFSLSDAPLKTAYRHVKIFPRWQQWLDGKISRLTILPAMLNLLSVSDLDILHLHGDDWFYFFRSIPTVRTLHGTALSESRHATSLKRRLVQMLCYPLERLSSRLATLTIAVGPETQKLFRLKSLADNGVDPGVFFPGLKTENPTILFVGTWDGRKRGRFVYSQFRDHVARQVPNSELIIVSDRCGEIDAQLAGRVRVIQYPDDATLAELYRTSWLFALGSTYEGFGIPYLEAMASGTAIITSRNPGAEYLLSEKLAESICGDAEFGEAMLRMLTDSRAPK